MYEAKIIDGATLWNIIKAPRLDWSNASFNVEKMYCLSIFSNIVYQLITIADAEQIGRATIVPSFLFQISVQTTDRNEEIKRIQQTYDISADNFEIHVSEYAVTLIVQMNDLVIISVRGTAKLYDWGSNFNFSKIIYEKSKFHAGFFDIAQSHIKLFYRDSEILKRKNKIIYLTGHSLGGAVAAILSVLMGPRFGFCTPKATYTFGMPRYGDTAAVSLYINPYQCRRIGDVVPGVPPEKFGFCNTPDNYRPNGSILEAEAGSDIDYSDWLVNLKNLTFKANHAMENYVLDIYKCVRQAMKL